MYVDKKYRIISQLLILGYVSVAAISLCDHLDKKNAEEQQVRKSCEIVAAACDITEPSSQKEEKVYTYNIPKIAGVPNREIIYEDYIYRPEQTEPIVSGSMEIPWGSTDSYMFLDYRTLTNIASAQYELQQDAWTDSQGFRRYGDYYMVAMGTYYGYVGDTFRITTDRGNCYDVIIGDCKGFDAVSYDGYHSWYHVAGDNKLNIIEFIVDTYCLDGYALTMGNCGVLDNIGGNIISIEKLG